MSRGAGIMIAFQLSTNKTAPSNLSNLVHAISHLLSLNTLIAPSLCGLKTAIRSPMNSSRWQYMSPGIGSSPKLLPSTSTGASGLSRTLHVVLLARPPRVPKQ